MIERVLTVAAIERVTSEAEHLGQVSQYLIRLSDGSILTGLCEIEPGGCEIEPRKAYADRHAPTYIRIMLDPDVKFIERPAAA